jgi:hypothetical protein
VERSICSQTLKVAGSLLRICSPLLLILRCFLHRGRTEHLYSVETRLERFCSDEQDSRATMSADCERQESSTRSTTHARTHAASCSVIVPCFCHLATQLCVGFIIAIVLRGSEATRGARSASRPHHPCSRPHTCAHAIVCIVAVSCSPFECRCGVALRVPSG